MCSLLMRLLVLSMFIVSSAFLSYAQQPIECALNSRTILESVTLIEYGEFEIQDLGVDIPLVDVTNSTSGYINVRLAPTTSAGVLITLAPQAVITANGQLADGSWLRVRLPTNPSRLGWVSAEVVSSEQAISDLQVVTADDMEVSPYLSMQAFHGKPLESDDSCTTPGLLLQTLSDADHPLLIVNGVELTLDVATLWIQILDASQMVINTLEGSVRIKADNALQFVPEGGTVSVPLSPDLIPSDAPTSIAAYEESTLLSVPIEELPRTISPAPPMTDEQLSALSVPQAGQWDWYSSGWHLDREACRVVIRENPGPVRYTVAIIDEGRTMRFTDYISRVRSFGQIAPGVYVYSESDTLPDGSQPSWEYRLTVVSPYLISTLITLTVGDCTVTSPYSWIEWVGE